MRISVGKINAHCENCRGEDFQPVPAGTSPPLELACACCGRSTTQRSLLMQVAEETVRRAEAFLEASRKQRSQPPR